MAPGMNPASALSVDNPRACTDTSESSEKFDRKDAPRKMKPKLERVLDVFINAVTHSVAVPVQEYIQ